MTVFSLHPVKAITTGEGGLVTTEDDELARRLRLFRTHGITQATASPPARRTGALVLRDAGARLQLPHHRLPVRARPQPARAPRRLGRAAQRDRAIATASCWPTRTAIDAAAGRARGLAARHHLFVIRVRAGADARLRVVRAPPRRRASASRSTTSRSTGCRTTATRSAIPQDAVPGGGARTTAGAISLPMFPAMTDGDVDRVVSELRRALPMTPTRAAPRPSPRLARASAPRVIPALRRQTLSKNPTQWVQGVAPAYVAAGRGRLRLGRRRQPLPRPPDGARAGDPRARAPAR